MNILSKLFGRREKTEVEPSVRYLGEVQRLEFKPGDTLVLSFDAHISHEMTENIDGMIKRCIPDAKVLVLGRGQKIGVLGS